MTQMILNKGLNLPWGFSVINCTWQTVSGRTPMICVTINTRMVSEVSIIMEWSYE
jgi:hypothetical protein